MRLRHLDAFLLLFESGAAFLCRILGILEGSWKEQEGLDEENIWAAPLGGLHRVLKRRVSPASGRRSSVAAQ